MAMMKEIEERTAEEQRQRLEVIKVKSKLEDVERRHVVALQAEKQVGWLVGLLVGWFVGLFVCWFVGLLVCSFVG